MNQKILMSVLLLSVSLVGCFKDEPKAQAPLPQLTKGDPCGLTGSVQSRVLDCSRAPDAKLETFRLAYRNAFGSKIWLDTETGLLVAGLLDHPVSFVEAQKSCRVMGNMLEYTQGLKFRVIMKKEISTIAKSSISKEIGMSKLELLTSDSNSIGEVDVVDSDDLSVLGQADPDKYRASALCVATFGKILMDSAYTLNERPIYSKSSCEDVLATVDATKIDPKVEKAMKSDAEFRCGGELPAIDTAERKVTTSYSCFENTSNNTWSVRVNGKMTFNCY